MKARFRRIVGASVDGVTNDPTLYLTYTPHVNQHADDCSVCGLLQAVAKGRCSTCYGYWKRMGKDRSPELVERHRQRLDSYDPTEALRQFGKRVEPHPIGCWLWTGTVNPKGYGMFWDGLRVVSAHRFAYEVTYGLIPPGVVVDHLCRVRRCVNPDHLEGVSQQENMRRAVRKAG